MKYLSILLIAFFMISCGGEKKSSNSSDKSIKGNWTKTDLKDCADDILTGMRLEAPQEYKMFESLGEDMDEVANCMCKQVETMYTSYIIADIQIENDMNEEDAAMLLVGCMGKETQDLYRLGLQTEQLYWPENEQIAFLEECEDNLDPDAPWGYCDCALDEFMTAYPDINDAEEAFMSMSMNDMMNMVEPCL